MSRLMRGTRAGAIRRGMTLIEIMISLVLLGIISGVLMRVIQRQQRFYQGVSQIMTQRGQLRQATSVLPIDLRSLSSVGGDIIAASESAMEFQVNIGTGIVCEKVNNARVAMPPAETLANGQTLTSWFGYGEPPDNSGAIVYIYNDSSVAGNDDDKWVKFTLTKIDHDASKCGGTPFILAGDNGRPRPILELAGTEPPDPDPLKAPVSPYIKVGAPVRIMKRVRYALYQASDGKWYLGFAAYDPSTGTYPDLEPVSGPYDPYASGSGAASGISFRYYDVDGTEIASGANATNLARIARVDLIVRGRTSSNVRAAGIQRGVNQQYKDSLAVSVMLRNRQ